MPLYEYRCKTCDHLFEMLHGMHADPPECPNCGGSVQRVICPVSFRLKGSGFHNTDYTRTGPKTR